MQAIEDGVSEGLSAEVMIITYQPRSISPLMLPSVYEDVPVQHPRLDDGKRKQRLRNSEEGKDVRVRNVLPPHDLTVEPLIRVTLSSPSY